MLPRQSSPNSEKSVNKRVGKPIYCAKPISDRNHLIDTTKLEITPAAAPADAGAPCQTHHQSAGPAAA